MKARLKNDFAAGSLELFLHSYFHSHSYVLDAHPTVYGSTRKPDFLVRKGECEFYLEGTIIRDESDKEAAKQRVKGALIDAINSIDAPNFFLWLKDFTIKPGKQPAARKLKGFLKRELPKYDPDAVTKIITGSSVADGPLLRFEDATIVVRISLLPRSEAARGKAGYRPIGAYPIETRWGGATDALRQSINDKATRYGDLDRPYIICANYIGKWGAEEEDILDALFGTTQYTVTMDRPSPIESRKADGVFMGPKGPWNTRVSGVIVSELFPWNLPSARFELYHNPWARRPVDASTLPIRQAALVGDRLEWQEGVRLVDLYRLPDGWPNEPATQHQ